MFPAAHQIEKPCLINFETNGRILFRRAAMVTFEKTTSLDDSQRDAWDAYVESHPQGTPYHLSGWLKAIEETYAFKPFFFTWRNQGSISGIFPFFRVKSLFSGTRLISLPFSDYGGALLSDDRELKAGFQKTLRGLKDSVKLMEVRGDVADGAGFTAFNYYKSHVLALGCTSEELKKKIDKRTIQYSIRKAEKAGVEVREKNDQEGMDQFYHLNVLTRKKHGVPCQPKKSFDNLLKHVIQRGRGFLLLAYYQEKPVGAGLFLTQGKSIHYKYNASDPDALGKITPNHLLTWHAMKKGCEEGFQSFNFGRTSPENTGLMRYKSMWGSRELDCPYFYFPKVQGASSIMEKNGSYQVLTSIWSRLPTFLAEAISLWAYKYLT
jgi:CelD/BcsL family acetyltransferase involved in cellulose biosynthesis